MRERERERERRVDLFIFVVILINGIHVAISDRLCINHHSPQNVNFGYSLK